MSHIFGCVNNSLETSISYYITCNSFYQCCTSLTQECFIYIILSTSIFVYLTFYILFNVNFLFTNMTLLKNTGLTRNKHQRMLKTVRRSCCLSMVDIQVKFQISHGIHVKNGWLQVLQKTTYSKYGRWLKISTMMKMKHLQRNHEVLKREDGYILST